MKPRPHAHRDHRRPRQQTYSERAASPRPLYPEPAQPLPAIFLKTPTWHPLIYRKRIYQADPKARPGDWVAVYHSEDQLLGYGLYNPRSEIAVRMLSLGAGLPDESFWTGRLDRAVSLRRDLLKLDQVTDTYRVIHAEGDGFPGLVVDRYGDVLSAQAFSLGMYQRAEAILQLLEARIGSRHRMVRPGPHVLSQEGTEFAEVESLDCPDQVVVTEYGTRFRVRFAGGHKTGFFCDQRDNRRKLADFCEGRTVLDLCCYTGGFALQAKRLGKAADVTGVDLDEEPLKLAKENANLNQVRINFVQADIFAYMRDMVRGGRRYDVVVLDPPKLITCRAEIEEGTRKHFDMNRLAMQLVKPGGILLSCTCAGLLAETDFMRLLYAAARQAAPPDRPPSSTPAREVQILARTGAAPDHPVAGNCPESDYLNAAWMRVW